MIAYAADAAHITAAKSMLAKIESAILFPLMTLMMAVAFFVFLWGAYEFVLNADDDAARSIGKAHMVYGIIGLLVMISAMAILSIAAGTFGITVGS
jgi:uncharacterized membrane protein YbhN (UPF0104 family)